MEIRFWGVRGSVPCAGAQYLNFGGHTSCTTITIGKTLIICDAGTGIFDAGEWIKSQGWSSAHLFLSHAHLDHVMGYPFFAPAWEPSFKLNVYAGYLEPYGGFEGFLLSKLYEPLFPVPLNSMGAQTYYHDIKAGDSLSLEGGIEVATVALCHPGGSLGYRFTAAGKSICYVTDTEHTPGRLDETILALIKGADLVIYDASYTEEEFRSKDGWGHSTWQEGIRLCQQADAKRLALYHHAPHHADEIMETIEQQAKEKWDSAFAARQGMVIKI